MDAARLIDEAIIARTMAYAPYSKFKVGCAILLKNGKVIRGANVENKSYGLTNCAERTALFKMVSEGITKFDVEAICIIGETKDPIAPCGACREVMNELLLPETKVVLANMERDILETTVSELLPLSFKMEN
ncbi:MAG: cytidine deaminase [Acholeplasmatales bacterium]|nr:cytidine deaminase [Acholeplasmatales bacterium]MCR5647489.1 cytidine deaminase [Acholeplasmatales bacterium]